MKYPYLMNKQTGELVTYSEAKQAFYSKERTWKESVFDEYEETKLESEEEMKPISIIEWINI